MRDDAVQALEQGTRITANKITTTIENRRSLDIENSAGYDPISTCFRNFETSHLTYTEGAANLGKAANIVAANQLPLLLETNHRVDVALTNDAVPAQLLHRRQQVIIDEARHLARRALVDLSRHQRHLGGVSAQKQSSQTHSREHGPLP